MIESRVPQRHQASVASACAAVAAKGEPSVLTSLKPKVTKHKSAEGPMPRHLARQQLLWGLG